ncbi:GNAT family N-acetyltransferase [Streptomyces kaempferi]|uniref:GNAT family N-acetyltransferase n=1 Tax=Streptomyces kaempferi TaxID=333725 RepID=A0ABW3XFA7_9ACTN
MDDRTSLALPAPLRLVGFGIQLREWTDEDVPDLVALYDDPEIDRWTPVASPFGTGDARDYLAAARTKRADGHTVQLAITTDGRTALGEILLFHSAVDGRDVELAYGIGAAHRRRGLAAGAVRLMVDHALRNTRARRAVLRIEDGNTASEGVAGATGFVLTDDDPVVRTAKGREVVLRTWCHLGDGGRPTGW